MSLEFISQICILLSTKSPGDGDHKHTVTHTHMHIEYKVSERRKGKNKTYQGKVPHSKLIEIRKTSFHFYVPHTSLLCLTEKPEIIIVLMKCRAVEKFF